MLRWLDAHQPLSLKLRGEVNAVIIGRDPWGESGEDFVMAPAHWAALAAVGDDGSTAAIDNVSGAISRRHYSPTGGGRLQISLFATDAGAAEELLPLAVTTGLAQPPGAVMIAGLARPYVPLAQACAVATGGSGYWCSPCVLMWQPEPMPQGPPDTTKYTLGPLTREDGVIVNSTWAYGGTEESLQNSVLPCIVHQRSLGLRVVDKAGVEQLVAWALGDHPYGAIGKVFTLESHRRQGFSAIVCGKLAAEIHEAGETKPFCFIVEDNAASRTLFSALRFELVGERLDWVGWTTTNSVL